LARAYLPLAIALLFSVASSSTAETADAAANALIVAASRDMAAAEALDDREVAGLMERMRLIASAQAAVTEILREHDTSDLAVRIVVGEIPALAPKSLDAAAVQAKTSLVKGIARCPDPRACLLNLAEEIAQGFDEARDRSQAFAKIAISLRDTARAPALLFFAESHSTLSQSDLDFEIAGFFGEIARILAGDGQVEMAIAAFEAAPADRKSYALREFGTFLIGQGNFDAAARLAAHPSLDADDQDELVGDLIISRVQIGDAQSAVYWLERLSGSADRERELAAEVAAWSGDAALASMIISDMPAGINKTSADIGVAGATHNVLRLKTLIDEVNALENPWAKERLVKKLATQFYYVGDNPMGDQLSQFVSGRDEVHGALVDIYIQADEITNAIDAAEKIGSGTQRDVSIGKVALAILARDGLAAADRYVSVEANHSSSYYSKWQIFQKLEADGRLAEAADYGKADADLADRAIYLSAIDLSSHESLETSLLQVLDIKNPKTMVAAIAALAYKVDR